MHNFCKRLKKWVAKASGNKGITLGQYKTKRKALQALELFNKTGVRMESDISTRRKGTGSISFWNQCKKWTAMSACPESKIIGQYKTKRKALQALELFNKTGERMKSEYSGTRRSRGTGSIQLTRNNTYRAVYIRKQIGCFKTKELAEEALKQYIKNIN